MIRVISKSIQSSFMATVPGTSGLINDFIWFKITIASVVYLVYAYDIFFATRKLSINTAFRCPAPPAWKGINVYHSYLCPFNVKIFPWQGGPLSNSTGYWKLARKLNWIIIQLLNQISTLLWAWSVSFHKLRKTSYICNKLEAYDYMLSYEGESLNTSIVITH